MALYTLTKQFHPDFSVPGRKPKGPILIDESSQYGPLLDFAFIPQGGQVEELKSGTLGAVSGDPQIIPSNGNLVASYDMSADRHDYDVGVLLTNLKPFTIIWKGTFATDAVGIAAFETSESGEGFIIYKYDFANYRDFTWGHGTIGPPTWDTFRADCTAPNAYQQFALVYNGGDAGTITSWAFYEGATEITVETASDLSNTTNFTTIGNRRAGDTPAGGEMEYLYVLHSELKQSDVINILNDPYGTTVKPAIPITYFTGAAAAPAGAVMNQIQQSNIGADLYNGTIQ